MSNFFDRFKPGGDGKSNKASKGNNPLANWFGGSNTGSFSGSGQSLGGNAKPGIVIPVTLSEAGSLGIKVEKSSSDTAIAAMIVPDSQAERAGLQRGDVLCFAGSKGNEEINYAMFLELAASNQRPLCFEIRRIVAPTKSTKPSAASASGSTKTNASTELSAEAFARKQAMIAAAEKREMEHNKKYNTKSSSASGSSKAAALKPILSSAERLRLEHERQQRVLENQIADAANTNSEYIKNARDAEQNTVSQLGYNPYVAQSVSAGQARNAVTTTTNGSIQSVSSTAAAHSSTSAPGTVVSPPSLPAAESSGSKVRPSLDFERAFETTVTSTPDHAAVVNSIATMRKLIVNATTKGQQTGNEEEASKYRKIRFTTNAKIRAAVTDMPGALDLLLSVGFLFYEEGEDNEPVLMYPPATLGPPWLPAALQQMERYVQS
jgi:PUB domain